MQGHVAKISGRAGLFLPHPTPINRPPRIYRTPSFSLIRTARIPLIPVNASGGGTLHTGEYPSAARTVAGQTRHPMGYFKQKPGTFVAAEHLPDSVTLINELGELEIYADLMLEKVFHNLADNSIRHGGNVTEIRLHTHVDPEGLTIMFEDNGIGIPAEEKEKIFKRGYGKHTGLGLFLVREILAITGITIRETGEAGKGARFEIHVPDNTYRISHA